MSQHSDRLFGLVGITVEELLQRQPVQRSKYEAGYRITLDPETAERLGDRTDVVGVALANVVEESGASKRSQQELVLKNCIFRVLAQRAWNVGCEVLDLVNLCGKMGCLDRLLYSPRQGLVDHRFACLEVVRGKTVRHASLGRNRPKGHSVEAVAGYDARQCPAESLTALAASDARTPARSSNVLNIGQSTPPSQLLDDGQ